MKTIKVTIKGVGMGLLMHNPAGMAGSNSGKKTIPSKEDEAKAGRYVDEDGETLVFPAWNLFRALTKGASGYKNKATKTTGPRLIASSVQIEPAMLSFGTKKYDIDIRRAVVVRQGILRARPLLKKWELEFDLLVNEEDVSPDFFPVLRMIVEDTGRKVGVGDFRPEKNGPFGRFQVTSWKVQ